MKTLKFSLGVLVFLGLAYTGAWFFMAHQINKSIDQFYNIGGPAQSIEFYGSQPNVTGFPFKPTILYEKGIRIQDTDIYFPNILIKAFPIPNLPLNIITPNGATVKYNNHIIALDYIDASFKIPKSLPNSISKNDVQKWQENVGAIALLDSQIIKEDLIIKSKGLVGLNNTLQPDIALNLNLQEYGNFIKTLVEMDIIKPFVGALTLSGMNGMAFTDAKSGQKYVDIDFTIQDQKTALGPIKIGNLPPIQWQ